MTISDVAWLAGKKEKTRPEISGAEKYDLRALESSLVAVAGGILVGKGEDVGAGGPQAEKLVLKSWEFVFKGLFSYQ